MVDRFLFPFVYPAAICFKMIRAAGIHLFPLCKKALFHVGVFPIIDHYYEPLFDTQHIKRPLSEDRVLPGIDWNVEEQIRILDSFQYHNELENLAVSKVDDLTFYCPTRFQV